MDDSMVLDSVPKSMRARAESVLKRLKNHPNMVSWNKSGEISLEGETIHGSNISDLIRDALKGRQNFNPTGSKDFFKVLSKINMPRDLIRNEARWKQVNLTERKKDTSSDENNEYHFTKDHLLTPQKKQKQHQLKTRIEKVNKNSRWLPY